MEVVDRGGFSNVSHDLTCRDGWHRDNQQNPKLGARAYGAALVVIALNVFLLNVTEHGKNMTGPFKSHVGKRFAVNNSLSAIGYIWESFCGTHTARDGENIP